MQLVTLLTGQNEQIAEDVLHPQTGLPGKSNRLSAYTLNRWLASWHNRASARTPQIAHEPPAEPLSEEEKQRVSQLVRIAKAALQDATEAMRHNPAKDHQARRPAGPATEPIPKAERDAMLLKALENHGRIMPSR